MSQSTEFAKDFIQRVSQDSLNSLAVNHPYLQAIAEGKFADVELVLKDFAYQYGLYSANFTQYVSSVIDSLTCEDHKSILLHNLEEELGNVHDVDLPEDVLLTIINQPHTLIFQRFQDAIGADMEYANSVSACDAGLKWSTQFLQLCETNQYVGIGAIGFGTELIVSKIYKQILSGLKNYTDLKPHEHVFFDLHGECDDEHAAEILKIAEELALDTKACEQIEYGAKKALELRVAFWDVMLARSEQLARPVERVAV